MAKQNLLLVDADQRSLRVLEVSLRKAGYSVAACGDAKTALEMVELSKPDLIMSDTRLPEVDGFAFVEKLKENREFKDIPFMFLSSDSSVESKVKGLELGVQDYLTKPIYIKEIITRINLELQRRQREGIERQSRETSTRFSGALSDMGLVDLLQTIDISRKSGVLYLTHHGTKGAIYFENGALLHAEYGRLRGEMAVYRFLVWNEGTFDLEFRPVRCEETTIKTSTQGLLMEGMRRLDEWGRLLEQLPPLDSIFEINDEELIERLAEIPDEINNVLKLFDGRSSLIQVVDMMADDDLATLAAISKLYFEGLIIDSGRKAGDVEESTGHDIQVGESDGLAHHGSDEDLVPVSDHHEVVPQTTSDAPSSLQSLGAAPMRSGRSSTDRPPSMVPASSPTSMAVGAAAMAPVEREDVGSDEFKEETLRGPMPSSLAPAFSKSPSAGPPHEAQRVEASPESAPVASEPSPAPEPTPAEAVVEAPSEVPAPAVEPAAGAAADQAEPSRETGDYSLPQLAGAPADVGDYELPQQSGATLLMERPRFFAPEGPPPPEAAEPPAPVEETAEPVAAAPDASEATAPETADAGPPPQFTAPPTEAEPPPALPKRAPTPSDHEALGHAFFSQAPEPFHAYDEPRGAHASGDAHLEDEEALASSVLSAADRRLRNITLGIFLVGVAAIGGFLFYNRVVMPVPAELGDRGREASSSPAPEGEGEGASAEAPSEPEVAAVPEGAEEPTPPAVPEPAPEPAPAPEVAAPPAPEVAAPPAPEVAAPPSPPETAGPTYEELLAEAKEARGRRAEEAYRRALEVNPNGAEALADLAFLLLNRGHNEEARGIAERAVAADPTSSKAWITLGAARQALRDRDGAREAYQHCVDEGQGEYVRQCRMML